MSGTDTVAVIGAGRMGGAMIGTLRRAGFGVVVHNRTRDKAEAVAVASGAEVAATAREAASRATVVLSSLADDDAVRDAYAGDDGVAAGLADGSVLLETSTIDPQTLAEVEPSITDRGATLIDAPVSGSVPLVERGELTIMVGGDADALEQARPALDALAKQVFHLGTLGTGATMKLAVNALVHATNVAVSESLVLAEQAGIERAKAYEVLASGAGASPFVLYKREAFEHPDQAPVAFSVQLSAKDLDLILALGERFGVPMDQAAANRAVLARAIDHGFANRDMSTVAVLLRDG